MAGLLDITPVQFTDLLRKGRGAAILVLRRQNTEPFRSAIETACRRHYSYLEDDFARNEYVYDLMTASGEFSHYRKVALDALDVSTDWRDRHQLFEIAIRMASEGDDDARRRAWGAFEHGMSTQAETIGSEQIIREGGRNGLLFVLRQFARRGATSYLGEVPVWIEHFREFHGHEAAIEVEEYCRLEDPELKVLLEWSDSSTAYREERNTPQAFNADFDSLKDFVDELGFREKELYIPRWSLEATEAASIDAAREMLKQTDAEVLTAYLQIYERRDFPLEPELLFDYATHKDKAVSRAALFALSRLEGSPIRSLALRLLARDTPQPEALLPLKLNYRDADHVLIKGLLDDVRKLDYYHRVCEAAIDVLMANLADAMMPALLSVYENSPCSLCRYHAVTMLDKLDRVPDWMLQECRWDSYVSTRKLAVS